MKVPYFLLPLSFVILPPATKVNAHSTAPRGIKEVTFLEDLLINTPSHHVAHHSRFDITFQLHNLNERLKLELEPNHNIIAEDAHIQYLDSSGNIKYVEPIERSGHRIFKGSTWIQTPDGDWDKVGWARIYMIRDGVRPLIQGAFSFMNNDYDIQLSSTYVQTKRDVGVNVDNGAEDYMIVYRDPYTNGEPPTSPTLREKGKLPFIAEPNDPGVLSNSGLISLNKHTSPFMSLSELNRRQGATPNLESTIGDTSGCPTTNRVALIGVATDCSYTASFNSTDSVRQNILNVINTASDVYERTFNISISLRNLTVSEAQCPTTASDSEQWNTACSTGTIDNRLNLFSTWRGSLGDDNAFWTLMSGCATGSEVGIAWIGQLCNLSVRAASSQSVSGASIVVRTPAEWQVFAHETGHLFGAVHDCDADACQQGLDQSSQCCPLSTSVCDANGQYIMNPVSSNGITQFSPCTIGNICSGLGSGRVQSSCLSDNSNVTTIAGNQCGNGIVEPGEECDCGGEESCGNNTCCDANTCRFINGAVCDDSRDACCDSCQFAPAGTVCRAGTGPCDVQETCNGNSSSCPEDTFAPDGQSCGNGAVCASGECTSRDLQCQAVFSSFGGGNNSYSCDSDSCRLSCIFPYNPNRCVRLNQNLVDGTPCSGGICGNGRCSGTSTIDNDGDSNDGNSSGRSWFDDHRSLVIGLAAGLGGFALLLFVGCIFALCRRRSSKKAMPPMRYPMPPPPYSYDMRAQPQMTFGRYA
ncbi:ADAM family of metalloprotease ADM-B [Xylogone sp. PMI_703]|nr:ADAM family of metalloprotease ADM-B [Xylogone sp. PMI_703]